MLGFISNKQSTYKNICTLSNDPIIEQSNYFKFSLQQLKIIYFLTYGQIKSARSSSVLAFSLMNNNPELHLAEKIVFRILMLIVYFESRDFMFLSTSIETLKKYCIRNRAYTGLFKEVLNLFEKIAFVNSAKDIKNSVIEHKNKLAFLYPEAYINYTLGLIYLQWIESKIRMTSIEGVYSDTIIGKR
jgi:hypothetical protein